MMKYIPICAMAAALFAFAAPAQAKAVNCSIPGTEYVGQCDGGKGNTAAKGEKDKAKGDECEAKGKGGKGKK